MGGLASLAPIARFAFLPVTVLLLLGSISRPVNATCFFPDGSTADSGHKECSANSTQATTCCAEGFQCLSNGLCNDQRYENWARVLRGACTNQDFGGACNDVCRDLWPQGDEAVWYCGSGSYCCSRLNDCCDDSNVEKHDLGEPTVVATAGSSARVTTSIPASSTSPTTSSSQPATSVAQTASSTPSSGTSGSSTNGRTIGIAVGTVVGVLLIALLVAFWFIRRKRRASRQGELMHELAGGPVTTGTGDNKARAYKYDDKRGGWITEGSTSKKSPWRNKGGKAEAQGDTSGGALHEVQAERAFEMPAQAEAKEMDGRGLQVGSREEAGLRSLVGSRRSRFVEVDIEESEGIESSNAQKQQRSVESFGNRIIGPDR